MKKYLRKALAVITAATMTLSLGMTAFAAKFPDVTEATYSWAIEAIESMAAEGIIKGYETGKFEPANPVSKLESLVLISRILGFNEDVNKELVTAAWDKYCEAVASFELSYGEKEVAYLMAKGVISEDELEYYIGESNRNVGLRRYEVAVLLTKAMDAEKHLTPESANSLKEIYADADDIPADAKRYVAFISDEGLMNGVDENFEPNGTVTRAQAAVMLFRFRNMTNYSFKRGLVAAIDHTKREIQLRDEEGEFFIAKAPTGVMLRYNGDFIVINNAEVGYSAIVTYKGDNVYAIDFTDAIIDEVVYGAYVGTASSTLKGKTIKINKLEATDTDLDTSKTTEYKVSEDAITTYNDAECPISSFKKGYFVKLTINDGIATVVEASTKDTKLNGRVNKITTQPSFMLRVEDSEGNVNDYLLSSTVTVKKNGLVASASDILEGDSVNLSLVYGRITNISATSREQKKSGIIKEVIISAEPRITVTSGNVDTTYAIKSDAKITIGDKEGSFYDFRVGAAIEFVLESDTVTSVKSTVSSEIFTIEGIVDSVNASYNALNIRYLDSATGTEVVRTIFVKSNASIVDFVTQRDKKIKDIQVGNKLTLTVSDKNGSYEAGTVTIIG